MKTEAWQLTKCWYLSRNSLKVQPLHRNTMNKLHIAVYEFFLNNKSIILN